MIQDLKSVLYWNIKKAPAYRLTSAKDENKITFDRLASEVNNNNLKSTFVTYRANRWPGMAEWHLEFRAERDTTLQLKDGQAPIDGVMPGGN